MSRRFRKVAFYIFTFLFIVLSVGVVFYAQGWRLDIQTLAIDRVGAIYVRSYPVEASIFLDGESIENNSWFFQNGTLINNLFPKTYDLKLSYPGYAEWHEQLSVEPALVTEAKFAVLVPLQAEEVRALFDESIESFLLFDDNFLTQNASGTFRWLGNALSGDAVLGHTNNYKKLLSRDSKKNVYYWTDMINFRSQSITALLRRIGLPTTQIQLAVNPDDDQRIFARSAARLWLLDIESGRAETIANITAPPKSTSTRTFGESLAPRRFLVAWPEYTSQSSTSTIKIYNIALDAESASINLSGKNTILEWISNNLLGILQENGDLYTYDVGENVLKKISSDIQHFAANRDGSLIAGIKNNALEIIPREEDNEEDYRRFRVPEIASVEKFIWYKDGRHIFLVYPNRTAFLDIDDKRLVNVIDVVDTSRVDYDPSGNIFYFLKDGGLMKLEFPNR